MKLGIRDGYNKASAAVESFFGIAPTQIAHSNGIDDHPPHAFLKC